MPVRILEENDLPPAGGVRVRILEPHAGDDGAPHDPHGLTEHALAERKGFEEGFGKPFRNMGHWVENGLDAVGIDHSGLDEVGARLKAKNDQINTAHGMDQVKAGAGAKVAGEIVGTAPVLLATKNPLLAGAGQGALLSDAKDATGLAIDAGLGAVLNKAGEVGAGKLSDLAGPVLDPAVELLRKAGVRLTPGQVRGGKAMIREDKRMSLPGVGEKIAADRAQGIGDFNRGLANKALLPLGIKLPDGVQTGHDAVAFVQDAVSNAYNKITPNLKLAPDARVAVGLRNAQNIVGQLGDNERNVFNRIVSDKLGFGQTGELTGRRLAVAVRDIRGAAQGYSKSAIEAERGLGAALHAVDEGIQSALGAQNPGYAQALKRTNMAYRGSRILSDAARGADEGVASTGQVKNAVRMNDRSKNQRATAAGRALLQDYSEAGRKVLPAKTPDSGTAGRLQADKLIPQIKGAVDSARYKADKAYTDYLLANRPGWAKRVGGLLNDLRPQAGLAAGGLFAGLLSDE